MPIALILLVLGAAFVIGGIKNWSISALLTGKIVDRGNPTGPNSSSDAPDTQPVATGNLRGFASPFASGFQFARIDQGVDVSQDTPYTSLGAGVVERISSGWVGGTGKAVYVRLNNPVMVNGRQYSEFYVAETNPLVKAGQRVHAGQPIASPGSAEAGFLINGQPTPLQGGLGSSTKPTQAGQDFYNLVKALLGGK